MNEHAKETDHPRLPHIVSGDGFKHWKFLAESEQRKWYEMLLFKKNMLSELGNFVTDGREQGTGRLFPEHRERS